MRDTRPVRRAAGFPSRCKHMRLFQPPSITVTRACGATTNARGWQARRWPRPWSLRRAHETRTVHGGFANDRVNKRPVSYHRGAAFYYLNGFQRATPASRNRDVALRVGGLSKKFPSLASRPLFRDTLRIPVRANPPPPLSSRRREFFFPFFPANFLRPCTSFFFFFFPSFFVTGSSFTYYSLAASRNR